ncbi:MAG: CpaF family protein [Acidimicrobiia bacterium]|nr:CpaF family protein [Acidimicrobiia bacterium]
MSVVERIHERLYRLPALGSTEIQVTVEGLVDDTLPLASPAERERVIHEVLARVDGLGPLHALAIDPAVTEIMVNAGCEVWVERRGVLSRTELDIDSDAVWELARRLAARVGRQVDHSHPAVDLRLSDGSRVHVIVPPLAVDGPCLTIRRFAGPRPGLAEMAAPAALDLLEEAVADRLTIVVAGPTSSGKTSLLNALGGLLPDEERIVTIEEAAELHLGGRHIVRLETVLTGPGAPVGVRELVRHALRMRPDRIICGEMRGAEALDLVQAMNTGHRGSLTTVHANSAADALRRIETMMVIADAGLPVDAIRTQLASCIDVLVMMSRGRDGSRQVREIAAVTDPGEPLRAVTRWCG